MNYYLDVLKKYTQFSGRAERQEYWMFVLINFCVALALFILGGVIGNQLLYGLYALGVFLPSLAVGVRRLHDTSHSAWWYFILLIPFVGAIIFIVWLASDSTQGANIYGPNPKGM